MRFLYHVFQPTLGVGPGGIRIGVPERTATEVKEPLAGPVFQPTLGQINPPAICGPAPLAGMAANTIARVRKTMMETCKNLFIFTSGCETMKDVTCNPILLLSFLLDNM
jgi:hypothetical protein